MHQIGEVILQTGGPHAAGQPQCRTERRIALIGATVETAEDIAETESDEQTIDLRQHILRRRTRW